MKRKLLLGVVTAFLLVGMVGLANATLINVDFEPTDSATFVGPGAAGGTGTWNSVNIVNGTAANLTEDGGSSTSVDLTLNNWTNHYEYTGANDLMVERLYGPQTGSSYITLSELDDSYLYDLYLYASYWDSQYGVADAFELATGSTKTTVWEEGDQYVKLEGIASNSGTIEIEVKAVGEDQWTVVSGLQIADSLKPVPEPATMLLFGLGLLGVAGVSRRKMA